MKWIRFCSAVVALIGLNSSVDAGLFDHHDDCGAAKSCGCASDCQPQCCKPTITRPCKTSVHTYQRKCSDIKPPCCDSCTAPASCCAPADCGDKDGCAPACDAPADCAPACDAPANCDPACAAPANCAPADCAPACDAPADCDPGCDAPADCAPACDAPANCDPACAAPANDCGNDCGNGCGDSCGTSCCDYDPCEVAKLIYQSQTACYAKDRRSAIHKLGDKFSCVCVPEIMSAFIYALNDADERVRAKAADEIGDQLRKNPCCCSAELTAALTCALADCDRAVRRQAEEALEACGYEIVDGCCDVCGTSNDCGSGCGQQMTPAPAAPEGGAAPAPAPPADPEAYFPSRLRQQQSSKVKRSSLANLFGLRG